MKPETPRIKQMGVTWEGAPRNFRLKTVDPGVFAICKLQDQQHEFHVHAFQAIFDSKERVVRITVRIMYQATAVATHDAVQMQITNGLPQIAVTGEGLNAAAPCSRGSTTLRRYNGRNLGVLFFQLPFPVSISDWQVMVHCLVSVWPRRMHRANVRLGLVFVVIFLAMAVVPMVRSTVLFFLWLQLVLPKFEIAEIKIPVLGF